jgi:chromosome segregation ATPase
VFEEFEKANATIEALSKKVNKKVMQMFEKAEQEYNELKRKKDVVEKDKQKIQEVMEELDEKKREALETTWRKVTVDFGSIFSTLLPGTTAKLEPEEGKSFLDGTLETAIFESDMEKAVRRIDCRRTFIKCFPPFHHDVQAWKSAWRSAGSGRSP